MISSYIIPILVFVLIFYGFFKGVDVYDSFINGTKESGKMIMEIFPYLLGMMVAVNIFINSGILTNFSQVIEKFINIPIDIIPMALMRPISGSSTLAILNNILSHHGPDSFIGRLACVIQGSTDTTFYVMTLYYGSIGIKKIRYSMFAGLFADLIGILASIFLVNFLF